MHPEALADPAVRAYLDEVRREVAAVDPAVADGIVAELAEHLRDGALAAAERGEVFDLDAALTALGDPAVIAAAVEPRQADPDDTASEYAGPAPAAPADPGAAAGSSATPHQPAARRRWIDGDAAVWIALALVAFGWIGIPVVGTFIGLALVWSSSRWRPADKRFGTFVLPALGILAAVAFPGSMVAFNLIVLLPFAWSIWFAVRLPGAGRDTALFAAPAGPPRRGALGLIDGPAGAAAAILVPVLAGAVLFAPVFAARSWVGWPWTPVVAGVLAVAGVLLVLASRAWSIADSVSGAVGMLATAIAVIFIVGDARATQPVRICTGDDCEVLLSDPGRLIQHLVVAALPIWAATAAWLAVRYRRGAARVAPRLRGLAVLLVPAGVLGVLALSAAARNSESWMLLPGLAGILAWVAGLALLAHGDSWRVSRWASALALPVVGYLAVLLRPERIEPSTGSDAVNPLLPEATGSAFATDDPTATIVVVLVAAAALFALLLTDALRHRRARAR